MKIIERTVIITTITHENSKNKKPTFIDIAIDLLHLACELRLVKSAAQIEIEKAQENAFKGCTRGVYIAKEKGEQS